MKKTITKSQYLLITALCLVAITSFFVLASFVSSAEFAKESIRYLAQKQTNVLALAASSTAASTALTLLPGDIASPLAHQLADINKYAFLVLLAVFIEKFMVTLTGFLSFRFLIPMACLILMVNILIFRNRHFKHFAIKLIIFALVLFASVPLSVQASKLIEETHHLSLQEVIEETNQDVEQLHTGAQQASENESFWNKTIDFVKEGIKAITGKTSTLLQKFTNTLNHLLEATVVLIVTSCVIPLAVMAFLLWFSKKIFTLDFDKLSHYQKPLHKAFHTLQK